MTDATAAAAAKKAATAAKRAATVAAKKAATATETPATEAPAATETPAPDTATVWKNDAGTVNLVRLAGTDKDTTFALIQGAKPAAAEGKRPTVRVKAVYTTAQDGAREYDGANAHGAITGLLKLLDLHGLYDIAASVNEIVWPSPVNAGPPKAPASWAGYDAAQVARFTVLRTSAASAADDFLSGATRTRAATLAICDVLSEASDLLGQGDKLTKWIADEKGEHAAALQTVVGAAAKNARAEFARVGRMPREFVSMLGATIISAKAICGAWDTCKNALAAELAKDLAKPVTEEGATTDLWDRSTEYLAHEAEPARLHLFDPETHPAPGLHAIVAAAHWVIWSAVTEPAFIENVNGTLSPTKGKDGQYVAGALLSSPDRNAANEIVSQLCKAYVPAARAEEAKEKAEETAEQGERAAAVNPRVFESYGVAEAAFHLANILRAHPTPGEVLNMLMDIADDAEARGWSDAMADAAQHRDAAEKDAADTEAENNADDAA